MLLCLGTYPPERYTLLYRVNEAVYKYNWNLITMTSSGSGYTAQVNVEQAGDDYEMKIRCSLRRGDEWLSADSPDVYVVTTTRCQSNIF